MPPKVRDVRLWSAIQPPKLAPKRVRLPKVELRPPKVLEFWLWRGLSAAKPAAESVLSSLPLHALHGCLSEFSGILGEFNKVVHKLVWSLI